MTDAEKIKKLQEYLHDLGWYPILIIDIEEVKEHLEDRADQPIDEEALRKCCSYVARKMDTSYEFMNAVEWAAELYLTNGEDNDEV
jgi:hypothetical protein